MAKRFLLCTCAAPLDGADGTPADAVEPEGFDTKDAALQLASAFPGKGYGYVYDTNEGRAVHGFSWLRRLPAN